MEPIRLQKWISQQGIASRREAERWIQEGRISINGELVTELGTKIDPSRDQIAIDGKPIGKLTPPRVYWLLNKPDQVLTSRPTEDERATIFDLPQLKDLPFLVSPVGRLDFRTEGLLLLSNDGELVHRLTHPSYKVPRYYQALIKGELTKEEEKALRKGVELEDGKTKEVELTRLQGRNLGKSRGTWYLVTVHEGRNRLVRRLFEHFGHEVVRLIRYGFGDLRLPEDLKPGEYRQLNSQQIHDLKKAVDLA